MIRNDNKQNVFRHTTDLYNSIQVSQLIDRSAEALDYNATEINTAINNLTTALKQYRAEHLESLKPTPEKVQLTESERKAAINFLKSTELLSKHNQLSPEAALQAKKPMP